MREDKITAKNENKNPDNLSLTGYRVLAILKMLQEGPHSEQEINEKLKDNLTVSRSISKDSIWLYINTLRTLGCNISRPSKKNDFKYVLKEHPYKLNLSNHEVESFLEVKKYISSLSDWEISCNFDKILSKISECIDNEDRKNLIKEFRSASRDIDYTKKLDLIKEIEAHCAKNDCISFDYSSPVNNIKRISMICEKLKYENGALYLWGYNVDLEESQYLRVDRINNLEKYNMEDIQNVKPPLKVIFKLYGVNSVSYDTGEHEKIIHKDEKTLIIQTDMKNKFKLIQKILHYGKNCEILEPPELRKELINKLEAMKKIYEE